MKEVNIIIGTLDPSYGELHPYHIFQLVAGTSTGGLIALMLGKIGLSVEQCILEYERLSVVIFGRKHWRGMMSGGLANAKYSGKRLRECVQRLLRDHGLDENQAMDYDGGKTAWYVTMTSTMLHLTLLHKKAIR